MKKIDTISMLEFDGGPYKPYFDSYDVYEIGVNEVGPWCPRCSFFHEAWCPSKWNPEYDCLDYKFEGKSVIFWRDGQR
jgi:hypothetical protein